MNYTLKFLLSLALSLLFCSQLALAMSSGQNSAHNNELRAINTFLTEHETLLLTDYLLDIADWVMTLDLPSGELKNTQDTSQSIFINGNLARVLIAAYRITGNEKYLAQAIAWADNFHSQQDLVITSKLNEGGFWPDFPRRQKRLYGNIYFADMGTASTSLSVIYDHADNKRKEIYLAALKRMASFVIEGSLIDPQNMNRDVTNSFIIASGPDKGALGCGYYRGHLSMQPYTISTAITGGALMSRLYKLTGETKYLDIAKDAVSWLLQVKKPDGVIPYTLDGQVSDEWPLLALTYCSEAFVASHRFLNEKEKEEFNKKIKPTINWLLTYQNAEGTWGQLRSQDQQRSPGVVTLLNWYYHNVQQDEKIKTAVKKYWQYLLEKENSDAYGVKELIRTTGFVGLAAAETLRQGVTF